VQIRAIPNARKNQWQQDIPTILWNVQFMFLVFFWFYNIYIYSICRIYYTTINLWGLFHEGSAISVSFSQAVDPHFSHGPSACAVPRVDGIRQGPTMCANEQRRFANLVDW
jgi:hypothetical protein